MLIIDDVKYEEWLPPNEDEFEQEVTKHTDEIFGEQSIYLDIKTKLKSELGTGSVPDGFLIFFGDVHQWRVVEIELSGHPLHDHIVAQVGRFISGIENPSTQKKIVDIVYSEIVKNDLNALKLRKAIQPIETYKFLSDLISKPPILTIIIEEETPGLKEALKILNYPQIKVVEFQTFVREGVGLSVHAHLFEPLYKPIIPTEPRPPEISVETMEIKVWPAYMKYSYIGIWKKFRHLFPDKGAIVELITDNGDVFQAEVGDSSGSKELWYFEDWYSKNPDLKEGDFILLTPIEPMKRYRLGIEKKIVRNLSP